MSTRKIIVTAISELKTGTSSTGNPWTLYKVEATDADGKPIAESLTTFSKLPTGQAVEVEIERRDDPKYGPSFTLKLPRRSDNGAGRIDALEQRVAALEQMMEARR
jgi:hypothetical protein